MPAHFGSDGVLAVRTEYPTRAALRGDGWRLIAPNRLVHQLDEG